MKAHGDFPTVIYRAFTELEYAQGFIRGLVRFGNLIDYRKIEDVRRRDESEGRGEYHANGTKTSIEFAENKIYIACFHRDLESAVNTGHGKYIVEVSQPLKLAEDLTRVLRSSPVKHFGGIEGVLVTYDKGEEKGRKLDSVESTRLAYCQKPKSFVPENEFRYIFIRKSYGGANITLNIGSKILGLIHEYT